jgi:serine/threonine protein kinase
MPPHDEKRASSTPDPTQVTLPPAPVPQVGDGNDTAEYRPAAPGGSSENVLPPASSSSSSAVSSGLTIGVYEVLEVLGRGGMGVVYRARHRMLGHEVALKMVLAGGHADPQDLVRFRQEAAAVARLRHPGLIHIHDFGEHEGRPYFAMDLVEGGSLAGRLEQGPLPFREAAAVVEKLARAVQHAHERGILHRDLKPGNVLLRVEKVARTDTRISGGGASESLFPIITDFGLAKQLNATSSMGPGARTQTGAILGTPAYMAPEQAGGKGKVVGPATDVYALGAILYECLTGQPPFQSESMLDLLMKVVNEQPTSPRRLAPKCPRDLEMICLKCLEKIPERRYATALALADDLQRFLDGQPISVRPLGVLGRFGRFVKTRRRATAGTIVALLAIVVFAWAPSSSRNTPVEPSNDRKVIAVGNGQEIDLATANQMESANKLKQMALALMILEEQNGALPPGAITDPKTGRPLLSWRVAVLPMIREGGLYARFKLDEPWDSPHNLELLEHMPPLFALPGATPAKPYLTYYRGFTGPGTAFEAFPAAAHGPYGAAIGPKFAQFLDGSANTLLLVEAAKAVEWTRPEELAYEPDHPLPKLGGHFPNGYHAALADGSVLFVSGAVSEDTLRHAITRNDGNALGQDWPNGPPDALKNKGQVTGRVDFQQRPVTAGRLTFYPEQGQRPGALLPFGMLQSNGMYRVTALEPGSYRVTVESVGNQGPEGAPGVRVLIPPKYANPNTSGLLVTVKAGYNTWNVNLDP